VSHLGNAIEFNKERQKPVEERFAWAPDFALLDMMGHIVRLSDFRHRKHVLLIFNRGFA
jgi:hypothetical protein